MSTTEQTKSRKKAPIIIGILILIIAILIAVIATGVLKGKTTITVSVTTNENWTETSKPEDENWTKDSTPAIVLIKNKEGNKTEVAHVIEYDNPTAKIEVPSSKDYTVSVIPPVNQDGSLYVRPSEGGGTKKFTSDNDEIKVDINLELIDSSKNQLELIQNYIDVIKKIKDAGDETLSADKANDIIAQLKQIKKDIETAQKEKAEKEEAERIAAEKAEKENQSSPFPVGTYSYVPQAGYYRGSMVIEASGKVTITETSGNTGETSTSTYQMSIDNSVTLQNGYTAAYLLTSLDGDQNRALLSKGGSSLDDASGYTWTKVN